MTEEGDAQAGESGGRFAAFKARFRRGHEEAAEQPHEAASDDTAPASPAEAAAADDSSEGVSQESSRSGLARARAAAAAAAARMKHAIEPSPPAPDVLTPLTDAQRALPNVRPKRPSSATIAPPSVIASLP